MTVHWSMIILCAIVAGAFADSQTDTGKCGFPGQPRYGTVGWNVSSFDQAGWEASLSVSYSCDATHVILGSSKERRCSEGKWTGEIPHCAEILRIRAVQKMSDNSNVDFEANCESFKINSAYIIAMTEKRRLRGIRLTLRDDWQYLQTTNWNLYEWVDDRLWKNIDIARVETRNGTKQEMIVFHPQTEATNRIQIYSSADIDVCGIELLADHDECGHPEVPIHGSVQWTLADPTATYRCDNGYQLDSSPTRHCHQGKWNGTEPICTHQPCENQSDRSSADAHKTIIICITVGLCLLFVVFLLYLSVKNRSVVCKKKPLSRVPYLRTEPIYDDVTCDDYVRYEEIRELERTIPRPPVPLPRL